MKQEEGEVFNAIQKLLFSQRLGVLGTFGSGHPYCSLVSFSSGEDLRQIYFFTTRSTRKFSNIKATGSVSILVDNRSNREEDLHETEAVTAVGAARVLSGMEFERASHIHLRKHPYLQDFVSSPSSALLSIEVDNYFLVRRFQNVMTLRFEK
ncbi:MAG: pyridoxamine 5'-phosphate oxidase family protein [Thermovirgaceae bacterium]|nr:pyridoxamine 5'-phosphate oxidase family protein [Thermovirgaceae bacterium]